MPTPCASQHPAPDTVAVFAQARRTSRRARRIHTLSWSLLLLLAVDLSCSVGEVSLPQVLPGFLSYTLLRFEINVRAAAVIGFVGAGGIG